MVAVPQIYPVAWLILALGIASRLVPWLERHRPSCGGGCSWSFSRPAGMVLVLAGSSSVETGSSSGARPAVPCRPADSPNVLLIVLDTVRADHLSLYGYRRRTTPDAGAAGQAGHSLRRGARDRTLDPPLAREHVHRPLAP